MIKCKNLNIEVPHPGVFLKEDIEELGISQNEFAIRADITPKVISTLISGDSNITFEIASKLAAFFGTSVEMWVNLQINYENYKVKIRQEKEIEDEYKLAKLIDKDFLYDYCGIDKNIKDKKTIVKELRETLMVGTLKSLLRPDLFAFYKTSIQKDATREEVFLRNAWISLAYKKSREINVAEFNKTKLLNLVKDIKKYTLMTKEKYIALLHEKLAESGIKYIEMPYLQGSNISGVTKWLSNENAILVAVADCGEDRYKEWFTMLHELGHSYFNHKRHLNISLTKDSVVDDEEKAANDFANNALIDAKSYFDFINGGDFSDKSIKVFAESEGVADFIVIGRLKKENF